MRPRRALLLLSLLMALPSLGDQDPHVKRGIASGSTYSGFDIDTINNHTGNLVLRIPLSDVPVGPFLSQALFLTYNSKLYDYRFVQRGGFYGRRALPETLSNAGFGWTLSLGRLVGPSPDRPDRGWFYRAPDGSEHDLSLQLDPAEAVTRDGSFLRFKRYPDSPAPATHREIELGDGTIHRFNTNGDLTQIRDRVGHTIDIDYGDPMKWVITNGFNGTTFRTTTVNFVTRTALPGYDYNNNPNFQKVVSSVIVPAFSGGTSTYELVYVDDVVPWNGCGLLLFGDPDKIAVPLLTEIRLPEGGKYTFTHERSHPCASGIINSAKLPTMGSIEWNHGAYQLALAECDDQLGWAAESAGVFARTVKDAQGNTVGEWTYAPFINLNAGALVQCGPNHNWGAWGPPPTEETTTVTTSEMRGTLAVVGKTKHYFSGARVGSTGYVPAEYGLPFTRRLPDSSNSGRFLSTERFGASDNLLGSTYLTYAGDGAGFDNPRVQGSLTVYDADTGCNGVCRVDTDRPETHYDGYGHYRKSITTSNFGPTRTTFTNYTPSTDPWILGTWDSSWVEEGGVARKQLFTFDVNGVLSARRTLVGSAASADAIGTDPNKDLLAVFCRDTRGFLDSERFFGGDSATAIPSANLCTAALDATEYEIDHQFTFDSTDKAPTKHTAKYTGLTFFIADEDLDKNTGLVSASRDVSGVPTAFSYDQLRRLEEVRPAGTAWTLYEYSNASGTTTPASLRVTTRAAGTTSPATPLTDAYVYYDWMGRSVQEKRKTPSDSGSKWATTNRTYDLFSRQTKVSVPEFRASSGYESSFTPARSSAITLDTFGRPTSIAGPDDKTTTISYTGSGVREIKKTVEVALVAGASNVTTEETYDAYGRLFQVKEPTGTETRHSYDLAGNLSQVCHNATETGATVTCGQTRTFLYDNRGFLTSETHPESGTVTYSYDARGHVLTRAISGAAQSQGNLKFAYDSAERLTEIQTHHPTLNSDRSGKDFAFGSANTGTDGANKTLGKLTSATRYNYAGARVITVKESYDYEDAAGRLSKTTTEIKKDTLVLQTLAQSQTYEAGGNRGTITYPTCITVSCGAAAWNTSTSTFTDGFLTGVSSFADSITYQPSGTVSKVDHTGPLTDTYTADETGVRPKSIAFAGHTTCTGPVIAAGSPPDQAVTSGQTATIAVSATQASGYQWFKGDGAKIAGQTGSSYTTPPVTGVETYFVEVYNDCETVKSRVVTVSSCPQLSITAGTPQDRSIAPEQTATLTVSANGATGYQWYEGNGAIIAGQTSASFTTPSLASTKTYFVKASNDCETVTSRTATVTVRSLPPPTGLVATANGTSSISILWNASTDADHYVLEQKSNGSAFLPIQSVYATSVTNSGLVANRTYVYRVRAVSPGEVVSSAAGDADLATTMVFTPLVAGETAGTAAHLEELLGAVNAVRAAQGTAATTWSSILPGAVPAPAPGVAVHAQHILSLRSAMNAARTALGFGASSYTDPTLIGVPIRIVHQTEIRGGVQ